MGFVYHAHYLVYFELGRTEFMRASGISYAQVEQRGHLLVVSEAQVRFVQPCRYDEQLELAVRVARRGGASVVFAYELRSPDGDLRASGTTRLGCLAPDRRPCRLPDDLISALEAGPAGSPPLVPPSERA